MNLRTCLQKGSDVSEFKYWYLECVTEVFRMCSELLRGIFGKEWVIRSIMC